MTLSEYFDAFDWSDGMDQTVNEEELQDHLYKLNASNSRSSFPFINGVLTPSAQGAFADPQDERGQGYEEYQKQVDLEILYQNAMIAHLQSKQISKRSQAVFSDIPSMKYRLEDHDQQLGNIRNVKRIPSVTNDEQHTMRGSTSSMHHDKPTVFQLINELDTQSSYCNELNPNLQELKQQGQESYSLSPRSSQGKRSSLPYSTVHKRRFALSFIDRASTIQSKMTARRSETQSSASEMMKKDASNTVKDLQRSRKKRINSYCTEGKQVSPVKLGQDPRKFKDKLKAKCDQDIFLDSHTPLLAEELNQIDEQIQEKYAESEREILRLLLEEDLNDDKSSQQSQIDILEQQFKRAIIAHQESKQKSNETFLLTHSTSLHQQSLIKYTKDRLQFPNSIQPMDHVYRRNELSNPQIQNEVDVSSLQPINTAGSLLHTSRLGLSQKWNPSDLTCFNIHQVRSEEQQQHYDCQTELFYRTNLVLSQNSTELCQQPMLDQNINDIGSSSTSIQPFHEPKSPLGQQVILQKRKVTLESIRAVEDLVSGRRSSLTKELEVSRRRLRDFISQRK